MKYFFICLISFLGSGLTLFSGFGLGTLLTPVYAIFFPVELAISMTAIVHFLNNVFKLSLLGKHASKNIVIKFGIPSLIAAFIGAYCLGKLSGMPVLYHYRLNGKVFEITPVKIIISLLLIFFSLAEVFPFLAKLTFKKERFTAGGLVSGFFGGLSGNQGAFRSAFLMKAGLSKEQFLATGIVIACMVDVARLIVYNNRFVFITAEINYYLLGASVMCAFAGAYLGNRFIKKVTIAFIQKLVIVFLLLFSILLGCGII
ncbi:MAG TPA: sulfite exporter TauE/SafE family protein [Bacteroidia bacterium]|nr:sulfite exporter TauE/SafE family protein [Bacteroidia bacterium]